MDYIIIVLVSILIVLVLILIFKKGSSTDLKNLNDEQEKRLLDDNNRIKDSLNMVQSSSTKELSEFKEKLNESIDDRFNNIFKTLSEGLSNLKVDLTRQASDNFEKTSKTFTDLNERISRIDAAQKNLEKIEGTVDSFKEILVNKKTRGNFGEFQLNTILKDIFGDKEGVVYKTQYDVSSGKTADAMLFLPEPIGNLAIDSKFPLENYRRMFDINITQFERESARGEFKANIKKHVDDISSKYIIKGETADQAIMFIPSEAVFAEVQGNFTDTVEYARNKKVWITSPSTLMSFLETIYIVMKEKERTKGIKKILDQLSALSEDFRRYSERWEKFERQLNNLVDEAKDIKISSDKISTKFNTINNTSLPKEYKEEEEE